MSLINTIEGIYSDLFKDTAVYELALNLQETMYFDVTMELVAVVQKHNNVIFYTSAYGYSKNEDQFDAYFRAYYPDHIAVYNSSDEGFSLCLWDDGVATVGEIAHKKRKAVKEFEIALAKRIVT